MTSNWLDWFPIVLLPVKLLVVGACMFYSIKWHYDQDQAKKKRDEISRPEAPVEEMTR